MIWPILKWGALALVVVLALLTVTGKKTFRVETVIPAPPEAVWAVLTNPASYGEWNPVFVHVDGSFSEGGTTVTTVREPGMDDVKLTGKVVKAIENREIHQRLGLPLVLTSNHRWLLEPVEGGTKVIQDEVDTGFYTHFWRSDWVVDAYTRAGEGLKNHVLKQVEK